MFIYTFKNLKYYLFLGFILSGLTTALFAFPPLNDINGRPIAPRLLDKKWVLVNVWANWCGPCLNEIREFNKFHAEESAHVAVFAIHYDNLPYDSLKPLIENAGLHYPSLAYDSLYALGIDDVSVVPTTYIFNPKGRLVKVVYGGQTEQSLKHILKKAKAIS